MLLSCNCTVFLRNALSYVFFRWSISIYLCKYWATCIFVKVVSWSLVGQVSVCLYSGKFTCTINNSPHFAFEYGFVMQLYPRYAIIYDGFFFLGGQLVLICVSTGPLTLTKIDFFCLYAFISARKHIFL